MTDADDSEARQADLALRRTELEAMLEKFGVRSARDPVEPYRCDWNDGVGRGWFGIIEELVKDLLALGWDGRLWQVKSKFGTLRFYTEQHSPELSERISAAEKASAIVCERCGLPGTLVREENRWWTTRCEECRRAGPWL